MCSRNSISDCLFHLPEKQILHRKFYLLFLFWGEGKLTRRPSIVQRIYGNATLVMNTLGGRLFSVTMLSKKLFGNYLIGCLFLELL